eukprot:m.94116 g.94116  ORF g.94116 m.94116 type:complete len:55 (-) comp26684_c0_seq1:356-520(-)
MDRYANVLRSIELVEANVQLTREEKDASIQYYCNLLDEVNQRSRPSQKRIKLTK